MVKSIIFDFDGVIAESVNIKTKAFIKLYGKYGAEIVNKVSEHHTANGGMSRFEKFKFYHKKYLGVKLNVNGIKELSRLFSNIVVNEVIQAPFVLGAFDFLCKYNGEYDFFILSATPESEIRKIASEKKIARFFKGVYGSPKSKYFHIENIIKIFSYDRDEVVFIGDSVNDLAAAKKSKIKFIARILENNDQLIDEKYQMKNLRKLNYIINSIP